LPSAGPEKSPRPINFSPRQIKKSPRQIFFIWRGDFSGTAVVENVALAEFARRTDPASAAHIRDIADFGRNCTTWGIQAQTEGDYAFGADIVIPAIAENVSALKTSAEPAASRTVSRRQRDACRR
jgi:hypothetical protein